MRSTGLCGWHVWVVGLIVGIVGTGVIPALASASTYYLAGSGSDVNAGTLAAPWRTIERAEKSVKAGDTVYLRAGTYGLEQAEKRTFVTVSGTAAAPISWLAYPGDPTPVFHGATRVSGAYNRISGVLFDGPSGPVEIEPGVKREECPIWLHAQGDRLDHSEVRESAWHAGVFVSEALAFSVDHDYIHDNGNSEQPNLDHGVYVSANSTGTIADNLIADNYVYGVHLYPNVNEVTINHNTIVGNGRGGVIVANESSDNLIANNIVANNNEYGIRGYELSGIGNEAVDNLIWNQGLNTTGAGMIFTGTTIASPLFMSASDYHLQSDSPAIGAAAAPTVVDDIEGNARSEPSTLGAYEYTGGGESATPEFVAASSVSVNASTDLTIAKPAGTVAGDVLIAQVNNRGGAAITAPSGWILIGDTAKSASDHMSSFVKVAGSAEPASYTFSSTNANGKAGGIAAWAHVDTSSPIVDSSSATGTTTSVAAASVTTAAANTPLIFLVGFLGQGTATPPSGFTERWDLASTGKYKASAESSSTIQATVGASGLKTATLSTTGGGWEAQLIALRPE